MENQNEKAKGQIIVHGKMVYTEIRIHASAQKIWNVFTDFKRYAEWNPFIKSLTGEPKADGTIEVMLQPPGKNPMRFKPRVLQFTKDQEFRWLGAFIFPRLFDGEHTFLIHDHGDGSCTFIQYERFRGLLVPMLKGMLNGATRKGFEQMNQALKARCEEK